MSTFSLGQRQTVLSWDSDDERELPKESSSGASALTVGPRSATSRAILETHVREGFFSVKEDRQTLEKIREIINSTVGQIIERRKEINDAISTFYEKSRKANADFDQYIQVMIPRIESGEMTKEEMENRKLACGLTKEAADRYSGTARQLIELRKLENEGLLTDYQGVISLMIDARMKEVDLMERRVKVLQGQENHELAAKIAIHNQQLKQEEFIFNRLVKEKEMETGEKERESRKDIDLRKQAHQEKIDWKKMNIDERKVDLEKVKLENEKEINGLKISLEEHRIDSDTRSRLAEAVVRERLEEKRQEIEIEKIHADERSRIAEARKPTVVHRSGGGGCTIS